VKLRARVAVVIASLMLLGGIGAGVSAHADQAATPQKPRGCVVVYPAKVVFCIGDLSK
jgi:hypothetical protein